MLLRRTIRLRMVFATVRTVGTISCWATTVSSMSIKVEVTELAAELERYGNAPFVMTSSGEGRPHIIQLLVRLVDGKILTRPGRSCSRNIAVQPELSLLWPAFVEGEYSLIVDGVAELVGHDAAADEPIQMIITPTSGILHRPATEA